MARTCSSGPHLVARADDPGTGIGRNGFFADPCTNSNQPFSPAEAPMGSGNTFTNVCYSATDIAILEPPQPGK